MKKIVAVIPARAGSKRLINKNLRLINGLPMLAMAINQAYQAQLVDEVYLSTDDRTMAQVGRNYGAQVPFLRPSYLAGDNNTDYDVMMHFVEWYKEERGSYPELIVQVRPTAPIRNSQDIDKAILMMIENSEADSLRTVSEPHQTPYKMWKYMEDGYLENIMQGNVTGYDAPSQKLPKVYCQDGVVDIIRVKSMIKNGNVSGEKILGYSQHDFTWDVDTMFDIEYVSNYLKDKMVGFYDPRRSIFDGKVGILQGRLTSADTLQSFPINWKAEFDKARECGYCYLELFRDRIFNEKNPLWTAEGLADISRVALKSGVAVRQICDDYVLNCNFANLSIEQYQILSTLILYASQLAVSKIVYPILDSLDYANQENIEKAAYNMKHLCKLAKSLSVVICLEINGTADEMRKFIEMVGENNISLCIDTGNLYSKGYDIYSILKDLAGSYTLVHMKDKDDQGNNVVFGTGLIDFRRVIGVLKECQYVGNFTFETARGQEPIVTAVNNISLSKQCG